MPSIDLITNVVVAGLLTGLVYGLMALGLSVILFSYCIIGGPPPGGPPPGGPPPGGPPPGGPPPGGPPPGGPPPGPQWRGRYA